MRASFQGQTILILGNGFAKLQVPPLVTDAPEKSQKPSAGAINPKSSSKTPHRLGDVRKRTS
jgi:hypothetical protein